MESMTCTVEGCGKDVRRAGYCYGHYMKNWRYGTPAPQHPDRWEDLTGRRFGALVATHREQQRWVLQCDCGQTTTAPVGDLNRGSKASCGDRRVHQRREDVGYTAAHDRVRRDRGSATTHRCTDCGVQAQQWSYTHSDPAERIIDSGELKGIAYSLSPSYYEPRCVPCHKRYDLGRLDAA